MWSSPDDDDEFGYEHLYFAGVKRPQEWVRLFIEQQQRVDARNGHPPRTRRESNVLRNLGPAIQILEDRIYRSLNPPPTVLFLRGELEAIESRLEALKDGYNRFVTIILANTQRMTWTTFEREMEGIIVGAARIQADFNSLPPR